MLRLEQKSEYKITAIPLDICGRKQADIGHSTRAFHTPWFLMGRRVRMRGEVLREDNFTANTFFNT